MLMVEEIDITAPVFLSKIYCLNNNLPVRPYKNDYSNPDTPGSRNICSGGEGCWKDCSAAELEPENYPWKGITHFISVQIGEYSVLQVAVSDSKGQTELQGVFVTEWWVSKKRSGEK